MRLNRPFHAFFSSPFVSFSRPLSSEAARELAPQFRFLTFNTPPSSSTQLNLHGLLAEVLRCRAYLHEPVYSNVIQLLRVPIPAGQRLEAKRFAKMQYIAVVYNTVRDEKKRAQLRELAEKVERCELDKLRNEQRLFYDSMFPSPTIPDFRGCLREKDLVFCYFQRELHAGNWKNIAHIVSEYPDESNLHDYIDLFLKAAEMQKVEPSEVLEVFMQYTRTVHPFFVETTYFDEVLAKVTEFCSAKCSEYRFDATEAAKKTFISEEDARVLKERVDEYVKKSKEGLLKWEEYVRVSDWIRKKKIPKQQSVVIVDALNYGTGHDPADWKSISSQFDNVIFATRMPPIATRKKVLERYAGNAIFCDKLSADDLLILRMALECGPRTCIVTNDQYRDHRIGVCQSDPDVKRIWDAFLVDAIYRHDCGPIEPMRDFNLRVQKRTDGSWIVPISESGGGIRHFKTVRVSLSGEAQTETETQKKKKNKKKKKTRND